MKGTEVADVYDLKADTVRNIYRKYVRTGQTIKQKAGHRSQLLTDTQKELICDWIDMDCTLINFDKTTILSFLIH